MTRLRAAVLAYIEAKKEPAYSWVHESQRARSTGTPNREVERMDRVNAAYREMVDLASTPEPAPAGDEHPEARCQRCGGPNAGIWHAPSPLWNRVMRDPETGSDRWSIVCPVCFAALAAAAGLDLSWHFGPHEDVSGLWSDASGRRWDGDRCLWVSTPEPAPVAGGRLRYAGRATPRISLSEDDIAPGDEPAPVAEGLREALHDAMEEDANQRGWGESKTTDLPMEEVHRVIDAVFLRYAAASPAAATPSPETE